MMIHSRCHNVDTVTIRLSIIRRHTLLLVSKQERKDCINFSRNCWYPNLAIYRLSIVGFQGQEEDAAMLLAADGLLDYS
jgi:hypothetical protein